MKSQQNYIKTLEVLVESLISYAQDNYMYEKTRPEIIEELIDDGTMDEDTLKQINKELFEEYKEYTNK
ncbi:MAG: hypothetical protein DBY41_04525 [Clostridium sp.]|nr:MAG: hypothetical protein DBY41_04525 [Clostridium sp.]